MQNLIRKDKFKNNKRFTHVEVPEVLKDRMDEFVKFFNQHDFCAASKMFTSDCKFSSVGMLQVQFSRNVIGDRKDRYTDYCVYCFIMNK